MKVHPVQHMRWKHDHNKGEILRKKILLVEDSKFLRNSLKRTLEYAGYEVTAAENGQKGLEHIQVSQNNGHAFNLLVTDILMPVMTGTELIQSIAMAGINIPVLVITNLHSYQREHLSGFSPNLHVLEKPFDPNQLEDAIAKILLVG